MEVASSVVRVRLKICDISAFGLFEPPLPDSIPLCSVVSDTTGSGQFCVDFASVQGARPFISCKMRCNRRVKPGSAISTTLGAAYAYSSTARNGVGTLTTLRMLGLFYGSGLLELRSIKDGDDRISNGSKKLSYAVNFRNGFSRALLSHFRPINDCHCCCFFF